MGRRLKQMTPKRQKRRRRGTTPARRKRTKTNRSFGQEILNKLKKKVTDSPPLRQQWTNFRQDATQGLKEVGALAREKGMSFLQNQLQQAATRFGKRR